MVRYFFKISYIGTKYRGSQKYLEYETVQGAIEAALHSLRTANIPATIFASRTDRGVHALMNTFHVDLEHERQNEVYQPSFLKNKLNFYLKENNHEIIITNASVVPKDFHARFHVKWRSYIYRLAILKPELKIKFPETKSCEEYLPISLINRCHVVPSNLNINVVKDVLKLYSGYHDFTAFTRYTLKQPWKIVKRTIDDIKLYELPQLHHNCIDDPQNSNIIMWEFYVKSASFLYHQVRKLVGTALLAGFGKISVSDIDLLLKCPTPQLLSKVRTAPACGLYLSNLHYGKEGFVCKESFDVCKE